MSKSNLSNNNNFVIGSLYQWALLSFFIVIMPLVFTVIYTVSEVSNYTEKSQQTLFQTVNTTENSRIILERLISMERSIRQFQVLNEPEFFTTYQEQRQKFLDVLKSLNTTGLNPGLIEKLTALQHKEFQLYQKISIISDDSQQELIKTDLNAFDQLTAQARILLAEGQKRVSLEAQALSIVAQRVRQRLLYSALASISLALIFAFIFVNLLIRPIRGVGQAIRNLGEVGFEQPISIKGPPDIKDLGIHLEWLRQRLNRLEYEKKQFIRNVSHELKTPLATLKEGTDLLSENVVGELNTEQQEIIQLMKIGNITINDLVENLLEYQRTISTPIDFNFSTFGLESLIERIADEYQLLLRSKNITLNNNLSPISMRADYDKLKIIISNLLSNALKFSPQNGTIGLSLYSHKNIIEFIVEDQGPGIAKDIQPFIFKDFYQGNNSQDWKIKASGLGLALVKYYLEAQQGSINLLQANEEFCGARFSVKIPQKQGREYDASFI